MGVRKKRVIERMSEEHIHRSGFFLVLDGVDGCGKSTQIKMIREHFINKENSKINGKPVSIHITAEPSKGIIGKIIRENLKEEQIPAVFDALLFAADRVHHCYSEVLPKLKEGYLVVSDRYRDSSYIYQSVQSEGQGNPSQPDYIDFSWIKTINEKSINPDLTIIIDIDPEISLNRRLLQNEQEKMETEKFEKLEFQKKIRQKFLEIAKENQDNPNDLHLILDGTLSKSELFNKILEHIKDNFPKE